MSALVNSNGHYFVLLKHREPQSRDGTICVVTVKMSVRADGEADVPAEGEESSGRGGRSDRGVWGRGRGTGEPRRTPCFTPCTGHQLPHRVTHTSTTTITQEVSTLSCIRKGIVFYLFDSISLSRFSKCGDRKKKEKEKLIFPPKCTMCSFVHHNYFHCQHVMKFDINWWHKI